ncbi:hypothetical protein J6590_034769 [Homalodisca vitripennis]|nr:hypothetical protein J6590_034769 [Homalodisca vitripennis]
MELRNREVNGEPCYFAFCTCLRVGGSEAGVGLSSNPGNERVMISLAPRGCPIVGLWAPPTRLSAFVFISRYVLFEFLINCDTGKPLILRTLRYSYIRHRFSHRSRPKGRDLLGI